MSEGDDTTDTTQQEFHEFLEKNRIDIQSLKGTKYENLYDAEKERNNAILFAVSLDNNNYY